LGIIVSNLVKIKRPNSHLSYGEDSQKIGKNNISSVKEEGGRDKP
jgi:hypothetical protein